MDNLGLIGKSGVGGAFPSFTGGTTQFEISSVDGMARFGAGAVVADSSGLTITGGTASAPFVTFKAGSNTTLKIYSTGTDVTLTNQTTSGKIYLSSADAVYVTGNLNSSSGGSGSVGTTGNYWGYANIDRLTTDHIAARTGSLIELSDPMKTLDYIMMSGTNASNNKKYLYFGTSTSGAEEWGIRSNEGTMQIKNRSGSWGSLGAGVTDHGALSGLGDQDHSAYSLTSHSHSAVTSVSAGTGMSFSTITSTGAVNHQTGAGWTHIPSGGSTDQVLTWDNSSGIASWEDPASGGGSGTVNSGAANRGAYYASAGTTLDDTTYYMTQSQVGSTSNRAYMMACTRFSASSDVELTGLSVASGTYLKLDSNNDVVLSSSSRKYKENIENLTFDTSPVYDLVTRTFKYKDYTRTLHGEEDDPEPEETITVTGKNSFGFIAEEVNEILPDLVLKNNDGEPEDVEYQLVSILLLEEMKKLKTRIEVLEGNG
jgi:hypothetical protein